MESCIYLLPPVPGKATPDGAAIHGCRLHTYCTPAATSAPIASCPVCKDRLTATDPALAAKYVDPLGMVDRRREPTTALRGLLGGGVAFLLGGGPSAKQLPLDLLRQRGCFSMAINNMAGYAHPNAFICADPPSKFHHGIWLDPAVMKFLPSVKFTGSRSTLRRKLPDGSFESLRVNDQQIRTGDCPNVWGYARRSVFLPDDTFFTDDHASWGNHQAGATLTGEPKTVMTMLLALRILYYLGARTIYLVGCDFNMSVASGYAFGQRRDLDAVEKNLSQFGIVNGWLTKMQNDGVFTRFGLTVYNTLATSGLTAFPHRPFNAGIEHARREIPADPLDLGGWYDPR